MNARATIRVGPRPKRTRLQWDPRKIETGSEFSLECGHCGSKTGTMVHWSSSGGGNEGSPSAEIVVCQICGRATFIDQNKRQFPAPRLGRPIEHLPERVHAIFEEARDCSSTNSFTAVVMLCRVILMHVAVDNGAKENLNFAPYVQYLADNGYVPPRGEDWVDRIRDIGNKANHKLSQISKEDAEIVLRFTEGLLTHVYEFPGRLEASA
jgi:hypothetical protein